MGQDLGGSGLTNAEAAQPLVGAIPGCFAVLPEWCATLPGCFATDPADAEMEFGAILS